VTDDQMRSLPNVLWIGGVPGAGKTTVARRLARHHGLRRYNPDTQTWNHLAVALAAGNRAARTFAAMTPAERAAATPDQTRYDRGPMVTADLQALPAAPLIVAEVVPPPRVDASPDQAVALMLSERTQRRRLERRHPDGVPPRYLRAWQASTTRIRHAGIHTLAVDGLSVDEAVAAVERFFAARISCGPSATTTLARRELLRYANRAVVEQYHGWQRYTPSGSLSTSRLVFDCECAAAGCDEVVELSESDATAALRGEVPSILADGHRG